MSLEPFSLIAFSAGVVSPEFFGRPDLEKYDLALAEAENFFVDYRGGLKNRPGTQMCAEVASPNTHFESFFYNATGSDFLLVFRPNELRIMYEGAYLQSGGNDLVISTPWDAAEVANIRVEQKDLTATITSSGDAVRELTYDPTTSGWSLTAPTFGLSGSAPSSLSIAGGGTGAAKFTFTATAVFADGTESRIARPLVVTNVENFTTTKGSVDLICAKVANAVSYRFYRSIVIEGGEMNIAQELGFIGESAIPRLVDNNIIPDFTRKPPLNQNPFAGGQVLDFNITGGGSGYGANTATVTLTGGAGSGFVGWPVVRAGTVVDILVAHFGSGYTSAPTVSFGGGGTGAAATCTVSPVAGNNPSLCAHFQQRRILAATDNLPNGIWGSTINAPNNYSNRDVPLANEAYSFYLDIPAPDKISHILAMRDSLIAFTPRGIYRLRGAEQRALTATDFINEQQNGRGCGMARPVWAGEDIIFASLRGNAVYALSYADQQGSLRSDDLSVIAGDLFSPEKAPIRFAWAEEPHRLLWVLRSDGTLLSLTYVKEQNVYAWAPHYTRGEILDICVVREATRDTLYLLVRRTIAGATKYFIEQMQPRRVNSAEEGWFVDCALGLDPDPVNIEAVFTFNAAETSVTIDSATAAFVVGDIGKHIRAWGGLYEITSFTDTTTVVCSVINRPWADFKNPGGPRLARAGQWTMGAKFGTITGLSHLNGMTTSVLADGDVFLNVPVSGGTITLQQPASLVRVGLSYRSRGVTLPLTTPDNQLLNEEKRIVGAGVRVNRTRGLRVGQHGQTLYESKDGSFDYWNQPIPLRSEVSYANVEAKWDKDQQLEFLQTYPLATEVLGLVTAMEV